MFGLVPFRINNKNCSSITNDFLSDFFNDDFFNFGDMGDNFKADIRETEGEYLVEAELPGVDKNDIVLDYNNNTLTISAKREEVAEDNSSNYLRKERRYGEFSRSFYVDNVDQSGIQARFKDGMLQIIMPKLNKTNVNSTQIPIQ